jgi:hypothetical protein
LIQGFCKKLFEGSTMWTDTTRAHHARKGLALPSDLTNADWALPRPTQAPNPIGIIATPRKPAQIARRKI